MSYEQERGKQPESGMTNAPAGQTSASKTRDSFARGEQERRRAWPVR